MASSATSRDLYRGADPREIPAYTTIEAAHIVRVPETTIRAWVYGRRFPAADGRQRLSTPLLIAAAPGLLSFNNLVEVHVLSALRRDYDVKMGRIRKALAYLASCLQTPRPLLDASMETDGVNIFVTRYSELINVSQEGQLAMRALLEAYLIRLERDVHGLPIRFFPFLVRPQVTGQPQPPRFAEARPVTIDPRVMFGRPVISGSRIPTAEVFGRFRAGDTIAEIAHDYERPAEDIETAIQWESAAAA